MPPHDRPADASLTFVEASHHGVVVACGGDAHDQVTSAVAEYGEPCEVYGGGGVVASHAEDLRLATLLDPAALGYTGVLDEHSMEIIAHCVMTGSRVYVATELRFDDVRTHLLEQARRYCNGHESGMSIVPFD